jgi:CheY-like chemotaxis protein
MSRPASEAGGPAGIEAEVDALCGALEQRPTAVLAIADEPLRGAVRRILVRGWFTVVETPDGALPPVSAEPADAVVADLRTPDGWDGVRRIRLDPSAGRIPIVGLVAAPREEDRSRARQLGVSCLVPVPFAPEGLLTVMERVTEGPAREGRG